MEIGQPHEISQGNRSIPFVRCKLIAIIVKIVFMTVRVTRNKMLTYVSRAESKMRFP